MEPEIRKALEQNTLPFGEMPRELQEALVIASHIDKMPILNRKDEIVYEVIFIGHYIYRLVPKPVIYPDYPWDLFDDEIQWMATDKDGSLEISDSKMKTLNWVWDGDKYRCIKFPRGNVDWKDSQMRRPKK